MHLIDTLELGGAERVAVNLVNHLPREIYRLHLCTTRREGPLTKEVSPDVGRLALNRRCAIDIKAMQRLVRYIQNHHIRLLHAHSTSLFIAVVVSLFPPFPKVVWHDHYGLYAVKKRPIFLYWLLTRRVDAVIAVSQPLAEWSQHALRVPSHRVWYIPNFVEVPPPNRRIPTLPGKAGRRIVCVANLRPQKDHLTLVKALALVVQHMPDAHLLLVGKRVDEGYAQQVKTLIQQLHLERNISWLGERDNVFDILRACDIGVLSSSSEGLPLALLEYGMVGLPAVATRVGQCAEVLDDGRVGYLVPPNSPYELAQAILKLLQSPDQRTEMGRKFKDYVQRTYSVHAVVKQVCQVYEEVLKEALT